MASPILSLFFLSLLFTILAAASAAQYSDESDLQISSDTGMTFSGDSIEDNRRSLFWKRVIHYYISYGALSANRIPCPPRSGRSYYTHNCYSATGPVHPYNRGCSAITRCRR